MKAMPKEIATAQTTLTLEEMPEVITVKMISEHLHLSDRAVYVLFDLPPDKGGIRNFRVSAGGGGRRAMKKDYDLWLKKRRLCGGNEISE